MSCVNGRRHWKTVLILVTSITACILGARGNAVAFNLLMAIETQGWLNKLRKIDCGAEEEHFDRDHVFDPKLHLKCAWVIERNHVRASREISSANRTRAICHSQSLIADMFTPCLTDLCVLFFRYKNEVMFRRMMRFKYTNSLFVIINV